MFKQITMTLRDALAIQAQQIEHYHHHNANLARIMASMTDVAGCDLDAPLDIIEINRRVPRGGDIESVLGLDFGGC